MRWTGGCAFGVWVRRAVCSGLLVFAGVPGALAQDAARLAGLTSLAERDPAVALTEIAATLALPEIVADVRVTFDLNRLAAQLLETEGRLAEASALYADLAVFAGRNRARLKVDPVPLWHAAARLAEAAGDLPAALRAEEAVLADQRDGSMPAEVLAETLTRLGALATAAGDTVAAKAYADAIRAVRAPPEPVRGQRGNGRGYSEVEIFYATDRARSGSTYPAEFYGAGRGTLETGIVRVTVPDDHTPGQVEAPSIWKLEFSANPVRHVTLRSVQPMPTDAFFAEMRGRIAGQARHEAFIFIHGYNVTFDAAARRAAQLAHDMNYAGLAILYSWPSQGSTVGYIADSAVVQVSARRLARFLDTVVAESGAETVHIVAHSMGNRALTEALEIMALRATEPPGAPPFGQIVFAAPDVDLGLFSEILPTIRPLAARMTLYASKNDWALAASQQLHGNAPRAGQGGKGMLSAAGIDSIDMSELGEDMLAHGYFAADRSALVDLVSMIWRNLGPEYRCGLMAEAAEAGRTTWRYQTGLCPNDALLSVISSLQAEGIDTPEAAQSEVARLVTDPALKGTVAPLVARMMLP